MTSWSGVRTSGGLKCECMCRWFEGKWGPQGTACSLQARPMSAGGQAAREVQRGPCWVPAANLRQARSVDHPPPQRLQKKSPERRQSAPGAASPRPALAN